MDIRYVCNPTIVLAVLASSDQSYYAQDRTAGAIPIESIPQTRDESSELSGRIIEYPAPDVTDEGEQRAIQSGAHHRELVHAIA